MQLCKHFGWSTTRELPEKPSTQEKGAFYNIEDKFTYFKNNSFKITRHSHNLFS